MKNLNLPPFFIGQKVAYITGFFMPKNSVHIVRNVLKDYCGCWVIYIDTKSESVKGAEWVECPECLSVVPSHFVADGSWQAISFRAVEEQKFPLIKLSEIRIKETEKVEPVLIGDN